MNKEEKKNYLKGYQNACIRILNLQEQLEEMQEAVRSIEGRQLTDMPKAKNKKRDLSDLFVKIEVFQEKIDDAIHCSIEKCMEIEDAVMNLEDAREARVLRLRYIKFMKWEEIQEEMCYSVKQIQRIHEKAITHLRMS